jgi:hypothetical protein
MWTNVSPWAEVDDERYDYSYVDPGDEVAMAVLAGPSQCSTGTLCGGSLGAGILCGE